MKEFDKEKFSRILDKANYLIEKLKDSKIPININRLPRTDTKRKR